MIDYINIRTVDVQEFKTKLKNIDLIDTESPYNNRTSELRDKVNGKHHSMFFNATRSYGEIKNSIHKMFNGASQGFEVNYDDFNYIQLCCAIDYLENFIKMDLSKFSMSGLEMGFNIKIDKSPTELFDKFIYLYDYQTFNKYNPKGIKRSYYNFSLVDYKIKIYDKGFESKLNYNLLRFEVKIKTSRKLKALGIHNLHDLKDKTKLIPLFHFVLECFDKILIVDEIAESDKLTKKNREFILDGRGDFFWKEIRDKKSQTTLRTRKKEYENLIIENNLNSIHQYLRDKIISKFKYLLNPIID